MRNSVVKVIEFDSYWEGEKRCRMLVVIDHDKHSIEMKRVMGSMPQMKRVTDFILSDKDTRDEIDWAVTQYNRKYPISISDYEGMSGCKEVKLYVATEERVSSLHGENWRFGAKLSMTMLGKISEDSTVFNDGGCFIGDLADLMYAGGWIDIAKHHRWRYVQPRPARTITISICGHGYQGGEPTNDKPVRGHRDTYTPISKE